jgi:death-on-curing family protein
LAFAFAAQYLEYIHDVLVARLMPFNEPIDPQAYRDRGGLDAAANRPFQMFGGVDLHPTLFDKAAALFHSLACDHCFLNGNKRTAVMCLDLFLKANGVVLLINNRDVYEMAKATAEANWRGRQLDCVLRDLVDRIKTESTDFKFLRHAKVVKVVPGVLEFYKNVKRERDAIRAHPLNNLGEEHRGTG